MPAPTRDVHGDELFTPDGLYADRIADRGAWEREAANRVEWVVGEGFPGKAMLEVGAATGEFVAAAESAGYEVDGLELSPWAVAAARDITSRVHDMELGQWRAEHPTARYGAVAMFHVLEHVHEPSQFLADAHATLEPGGRIFIEIPNGGSPDARRNGGREWWMAALSDHVCHFTAASVRKLLTDAGFVNVEVQELTMAIYGGARPSSRDIAKSVLRTGRIRANRDLLRAVGTRR